MKQGNVLGRRCHRGSRLRRQPRHLHSAHRGPPEESRNTL
jgi:hypothetical protein